MPAGFIEFELDLMKAIMDQLVPALDNAVAAPLVKQNTLELPDAQGVYLLIYDGRVRYIGKTDAEAGLRTRLTRHTKKFELRRNVAPAEVSFKAAQILVLTAMDVESKLIKHYGEGWNGSGFGSNDPGRNREETNKPEAGFDAQFPVDIDVSDSILPPGVQTVHSALMRLKDSLPFTLRYELAPGKAKSSHGYRLHPHPDYVAHSIDVPDAPLTTREAMKLIVGALPPGWQATVFSSHVILYKEARAYTYGTVI